MLSLQQQYRAYLIRVAETEGESAFSKMQFPGLLPIVASVAICYILDVEGTSGLWVVLPAGVISLAGIIYVWWVMMIDGPIAINRKAKRNRRRP